MGILLTNNYDAEGKSMESDASFSVSEIEGLLCKVCSASPKQAMEVNVASRVQGLIEMVTMQLKAGQAVLEGAVTHH